MSKEETAEINQDADNVVSLCTEKDRLVKRMVARILNCEDQAEKRTNMLLLWIWSSGCTTGLSVNLVTALLSLPFI